MAKSQKKTGKGRLDKYYRLAKEQGYRARSAFKLVQLNKKYGFLESARCCIDLCAAPGGWLQVASKSMPVNSIIVGVDLVPIRPIPRVTTFAADITTSRCRDLIRNELKDWKADVVLHDGAPNVGTAWIQDAYSQAELVLMSLRLAVEFLMKGGTFITKVFRSADYNNLLWIFGQLFGKVEATKPPSSRNVSAEIFVVCRDYLAPNYIDPKFLDPKHAFKDVATLPGSASTSAAQLNVFKPEVKRRKRDGYEDGDYTLFKRLPAKDFVLSDDPIGLLSTVNQIHFDDDKEDGWLKLDMTTPDIVSNLKDLKVLGKGDFKALLKWRTSLRKYLSLDAPAEKDTQRDEIVPEEAAVDSEDDDDKVQADLEKLDAEEKARQKREKRKANERKTRTIRRMQLQMTAPMDIGMEQHDQSLQAGQDDLLDRDVAEADISSESDPASDMDDDAESVDSSSPNKKMEDELDALYEEYNRRKSEKDAKFKVQEMRKKNKYRDEEWRGIDENANQSGSEEEGRGGWDYVERMKAKDDSDSDSDSGSDEPAPRPPQKRQKREPAPVPPKNAKAARAVQQWFGQDLFEGMGEDFAEADEAEDVEMGSEGGEVSEDDVWEAEQESDDDEIEIETAPAAKKLALTTPEAVTLAQQLVNRQTTLSKMVDDGFNRLAFNDKDGLPKWFLDDEATHYKTNLPVTKQAMEALRARQRALDARPIKKVAEAKARKKFKAAQRLTKAAKKAETVNEDSELTEKEKASQIMKLMAKGHAAQAKRKELKVVVAKGTNRGVKGRPKGVKGRYLMVDARMRKEMRAKKRIAKASKTRK